MSLYIITNKSSRTKNKKLKKLNLCIDINITEWYYQGKVQKIEQVERRIKCLIIKDC